MRGVTLALLALLLCVLSAEGKWFLLWLCFCFFWFLHGVCVCLLGREPASQMCTLVPDNTAATMRARSREHDTLKVALSLSGKPDGLGGRDPANAWFFFSATGRSVGRSRRFVHHVAASVFLL